jgi:MFS family permease
MRIRVCLEVTDPSDRGVVSAVQAAAQNYEGMLALRFLMGMFEAGYGPGVPYLLSFFYLRHELGWRTGLFMSAAPLANTFAGALAYAITSGRNTALHSWRLLFLVEGLPTVAMAFVAFFFMPDAPEKARFLSEDEKVAAKARGVRQAGEGKRWGSIAWKEIPQTLGDAKAWFTAVRVDLPGILLRERRANARNSLPFSAST